MDPAIVGTMRVGYFRVGAVRDDWDRLLKKFENIASCDVTRRRLVLGAKDATTGWYKKAWIESTIEGILIPRAMASIAVTAGAYVRLDALFITADPLEVGDEIKTDGEHYYEVKAVQPHRIGNNFYRRDADLTYLPFHNV